MIRPPSACITIPLGNTGANEGGSLALRTEQGRNLSSRREGRGGYLCRAYIDTSIIIVACWMLSALG
jgi:hypothetical protein